MLPKTMTVAAFNSYPFGDDWIESRNCVPPPPDDSLCTRRVLVWCDDYCSSEPRIGYYLNSLKKWRIDQSPSDWNVTHWMPFPRAPRKRS